jgi:threonine dehydrogenase-like Zn-dependent dehydrogenase
MSVTDTPLVGDPIMEVKAAVTLRAGKIETRLFPYPKVEPDCMLVKMKMSGVCGTDKHIFKDRMPELPFPIIQGHENVGVIQEIGEKAQKVDVLGNALEEGDRITWYPSIPCGKCWYCTWLPSTHGYGLCSQSIVDYGFTNCEKPPHLFGGWSEYVYLRAGTWIYRIPDSLPTETAVLVDVLASVNGIERAQSLNPFTREGFGLADVVVIQGSGPIGVMAAFKSKAMGASNVIMVGAPRNRLKLAEKFGVDSTINIEEVTGQNDRVKQITDLTHGIGADMVVDCTGVPSAVPEGIEMTRRGGVYVELGAFTDGGPVSINPYRLCYKDIILIGQYGYPPHQYRKDLWLLEKHKDTYPFQQLVSHKFELGEAEEAIRSSERLECMKAALVP